MQPQKDALEAALDRFDARERESEKQRVAQRTAEDVFRAAFKKACADVIRPTLESLGQRIKARGHDYSIETREEGKDDRGAQIEAGIELRIFTKGSSGSRHRLQEWPGLGFIAEPQKEKVFVHGSSIGPGHGGSGGGRGELALNAITPEYIVREFTAVFTELVGR